MKILLIGRTGQVGSELAELLPALGELIATDRAALDLTQPDAIRQSVRALRPDVIVNAAAYTAVDKAESEASLAMRINAAAPGVLAEEANRTGALLVHYSTDYVFDGKKGRPYVEDDAPNPLNAYGRSKLEGEQAIAAAGGRHLILRTSWVYGLRGRNFLRTILDKAGRGEPLRVVDDQVGAPTWARHIAEATVRLLCAPDTPHGLCHMSAGGSTTWHGFALAILEASGLRADVESIGTAQYPAPAMRPRFSVLDCTLLQAECGIALPPWRTGLDACLTGR